MLFNSFAFAVFLPIVFFMYWFIANRNLRAQNLLLLIASFVFYGWWDWRFLFLLMILSFANYFTSIAIDNNALNNNKKKIWLVTGLIINIGILGFFKYYNFFVDSFIDLISLTGYKLPKSTLKIILPLGISFYVFISVSYLIDIYKETFKASKNLVAVLLSLSFFPIILAGPIQRPSLLLPQINKKREFSYDRAIDGLSQILWGLFTKIAIADKVAYHVDNIFLKYSDLTSSTLVLGAILYSIQIYADFSGYSNIAIGTARIFGFDLIRNFNYPYFSKDITEFWKRWHISLTSWFRDYIFLPLSFLISSKIKSDKVLFIKSDLFIYIIASGITWLLTGLWHGANYKFIIWGAIQGVFLILYHIQKNPRKRLFNKIGIAKNNSLVSIIETLLTLIIIMISWIFFRAENVTKVFDYLSDIFSKSIFSLPQVFPKNVLLLLIVFMVIEWMQRQKNHALQIENLKYRIVRWGVYYGIIILIIISLGDSKQSFIYSQF